MKDVRLKSLTGSLVPGEASKEYANARNIRLGEIALQFLPLL